VHGDKIHDSNKQCSKLERKGSMESNTGIKPETHPAVIRTKAVRCTKVIIPWQLDNQMANKNLLPVWDCDSPCCSAQQEDNSCGFLKDFDINELLISGVLYSDQDKEINECEILVDGDVQSKNMSSSCHEHFPLLSRDEAKLEDSMDEGAIRPQNWRASIDPFQPNDALDLTTLASFLNSEDEWIC
jgi:myb proto-oncogene protein